MDDFQENWGDDQIAVVGRAYTFVPVESAEAVFADSLYYIRNGDDGLLVRTPDADQLEESITLVNVLDNKSMEPLPIEAFLRLGQQRRLGTHGRQPAS